MKIVDLDQGSPEWHLFRATHLTASQAPEMMGEGYGSRDAFIRNWGKEKNISSYQEMLFAKGHELEARALPFACEIVGEDLAPMSGVYDGNGLPDAIQGRLSASFDGIDMEHTVLWEHKTWNQKIQAAIDAGQIPLQHRIQMEQQLLVSGADQCLFMASNEAESCHQWYLPDLELRESICDGWVQFLKDLEDTPDVTDLSQDADWLILEGQYEAVMKKLASAEMSAKHLKGLMFEYAQERDVVGLNYRVQKTTRKGSISYAKAFKSLMPQADLEPFRGELVETLQLKEVKNG